MIQFRGRHLCIHIHTSTWLTNSPLVYLGRVSLTVPTGEFVIHQPPNYFGDLLHVRVIDIPSNRFIFENRSGHRLESQGAWGLVKLTQLNHEQRARVISVLSAEKAPNGGSDDCQNWLISGLVALEVDELVPDGTAETWTRRVGKPTMTIKGEAGANWASLNGR